MRRREFIAGLGAAAGWPLMARAQQPDRMRRIVVLMGFPASDPEAQARATALMHGLRDLGWIEGRNLRFEYRWGVESVERTRTAAAEAVATKPDIIIATTTTHGQELARQTRTIRIPVVFINLSDPVDSGVVANLARPGGNVTGFMSMEGSVAGKWLELLKGIAPGISRVLVLMNAGNAGNLSYLRIAEASAPPLGIRLSVSAVRDASEIEGAVAAIAGEADVGIIVMPGDPNQANRRMIFELVARHRIPAAYAFRFYATDGGLLSYGPDTIDLWRRTVSYIDRILRGEKPGELPVQAPTKFELIINLKTAKMLGLTIPETLLATADQLIE
jgi:putative tryptophan/tyrosine transport system substrate-binding protein